MDFLGMFLIKWVAPVAVVTAVLAIVFQWSFTFWLLLTLGVSVIAVVLAVIAGLIMTKIQRTTVKPVK